MSRRARRKAHRAGDMRVFASDVAARDGSRARWAHETRRSSGLRGRGWKPQNVSPNLMVLPAVLTKKSTSCRQ